MRKQIITLIAINGIMMLMVDSVSADSILPVNAVSANSWDDNKG